MTSNCPRCGFSQPKDRYCANCGVDMEKYKPRDRSFSQKILSSSGFYVALLVAVFIATIYMVTRPRQEESITFATLEPKPPSEEPKGNLNNNFSVSTDAISIAPENSNAEAPPAVAAQSQLGEPAATPPGGPNVTRLRIIYAEVPFRLLKIFYQGGATGAFAKSDFDTLIEGTPEAKAYILNSHFLTNLESEVTVTHNVETSDSRLGEKDKIGGYLEITPHAMTANMINLDIAVTLKFPEEGSENSPIQILSNTFRSVGVTLNQTSGAYLMLTLPRRVLKEGEKALIARNEILKIMNFPQFTVETSPSELFLFVDQVQ